MNGVSPRRRDAHRHSKRRVHRMNELERRVDRLESEIEWLRRAIAANGERDGPLAVGACPNCPTGVLVRYGDELRCDACGYRKWL